MGIVTAPGKGKIVKISNLLQSGHDKFETLTWPYIVALPFMVLIAMYVNAKRKLFNMVTGREPSTNFWFVDGISHNSRKVKDGHAKWPALETTYNFSQGEGSNSVVRTIDHWWMNIRNAQAVRNRLKIAKRELKKAIVEQARAKKGKVEIVSLAAGSAQAVIEVISELQNSQSVPNTISVRALLVDIDTTALRYAQKLAEQHNVSHLIETKEDNVLRFDHALKKLDCSPDIVEMMGLLDYLDDKLAVLLIKKIHRVLPKNGIFLTCHIHPNSEEFFVRNVVNWNMLYRSVRKLNELIVDGGFRDISVHTEPHNIHSVAVGFKLS